MHLLKLFAAHHTSLHPQLRLARGAMLQQPAGVRSKARSNHGIDMHQHQSLQPRTGRRLAEPPWSGAQAPSVELAAAGPEACRQPPHAGLFPQL